MGSDPFAGVSCVRRQIGGVSTQPTDAATPAKLLRVDYAYIWKVGVVLLIARLFTIRPSAATGNGGCLPGAARALC